MEPPDKRANYFDTLLPKSHAHTTSSTALTPPVTTTPLSLSPSNSPTSASKKKDHRYVNLVADEGPSSSTTPPLSSTPAATKKGDQYYVNFVANKDTPGDTKKGVATPTSLPPLSATKKKNHRYVNLVDDPDVTEGTVKVNGCDLLVSKKKDGAVEIPKPSCGDVVVCVTGTSVGTVPVVPKDPPTGMRVMSSYENLELTPNGSRPSSSVIGSERASSISSNSTISSRASPVYENFIVQDRDTPTSRPPSSHSPSPQPKEDWVPLYSKKRLSSHHKSQSLDLHTILPSGDPSSSGYRRENSSPHERDIDSSPSKTYSYKSKSKSLSPFLSRTPLKTSSYENISVITSSKTSDGNDDSKRDSKLIVSRLSTHSETALQVLGQPNKDPKMERRSEEKDSLVWMDFSRAGRRTQSEKRMADKRKSRSVDDLLWTLEETSDSSPHRPRSNAMSEKKDPGIKEAWRRSHQFRFSIGGMLQEISPKNSRKKPLNYIQVSFPSDPEVDAQTHNRPRTSGSPAAFKIIGKESTERVEYVEIDLTATKAVNKTLRERNEELRKKRDQLSNKSVR